MTSEEMDADKTELEDLITQAEAEIELNPAEFIVVGNIEDQKHRQKGLVGNYESCLQNFGEWKKVYATVLKTAVETALKVKMTTFKTDW